METNPERERAGIGGDVSLFYKKISGFCPQKGTSLDNFRRLFTDLSIILAFVHTTSQENHKNCYNVMKMSIPLHRQNNYRTTK